MFVYISCKAGNTLDDLVLLKNLQRDIELTYLVGGYVCQLAGVRKDLMPPFSMIDLEILT